jgi:hypothetical protein
MNGHTRDRNDRLRRLRRWSLVLGILAAVALGVGGYFDPSQFFRAYLSAYLFVFGIASGSLALLMIYCLTGGAWGFLIRRFLEHAVGTLPLLAVAFLPIAFGTKFLYPFAQDGAAAESELLRFQQSYLNIPYFQARAAGYFLLWMLLGFLLLAWSRRQYQSGDQRYARWCENLSGPGLVIYGVTIHFASIDWLLSLQPAFHSTIFGPIVAGGQILSAEALALVMLVLLRNRLLLAERLSPKALNDLGNLLLAFVIVWGYLCWAQYMLIWIANLPVDVVWYAPRLRHGWQWMALALVIVGFALPMILLLWRSAKQDVRTLGAIAGLLLIAQAVFSIFQVSPAFFGVGLRQHWMEWFAPFALGGLWFWVFLGRVSDHSLLPMHDPNEASALRLRRSDDHEAVWEEIFAHE